MVEFRKLQTLEEDTMVSQYLADMYDGGTVTADLLGGMTKNKYLFKSSVAQQPTFGAAELKKLDFDFYVNSIAIGEGTTNYPEVASYLLKEGISITEGYTSRIDADILVFSSVMDGFTSMEDNMDGTGNSGGDGSVYTNIARTIFREDQLYCTVDDAKEYGQKGYKWRHGKDKHSNSEIRNDFGLTATTLGISDAEGSGSTANYIKVSTDEKYSWIPSGKFASLTKIGFRKCMPNEAHTGIGYEIWIRSSRCKSGNSDMSTTEGYGNEVTPSNTIFELVRGSAEYSNWDEDANSQSLLGVGIARFNTETFLSGAQSLEMFTFWTGLTTNINKVSYSNKKYDNNSTVYTGGPANRQEVLLVKKNIPYPNKKAALPKEERDGTHRTVTVQPADDKIKSEGHGLYNGDIIYVEEDSWNSVSGTSSGSNGGESTSWETNQNAGRGAYVRRVDSDYFKVAGTNADTYLYNLSTQSTGDQHIKIGIVDDDNQINGQTNLLTESSFDDYDFDSHASFIEMDINIKKLAKAYSWVADEGELYNEADTETAFGVISEQHLLSLNRGFHVVMGTEPPEANDTLYDYIARMSNLHDRSGATDNWRIQGIGGSITGTDEKDTLWGIRGSMNHNKLNSDNACFGGFSVLNTEHGLQVIPFNGVQGSDGYLSGTYSANYNQGAGLFISDHDIQEDGNVATALQGSLILRQEVNSANSPWAVGATGDNVQVPIEDQWSKFILAFNPKTSKFYPSSTATSSRGEFSLGRLYISDSEGKLNTLGSKGSGVHGNKKYLDLALFGDGAAYFSYDANPGTVTAGSFVTGEKYQIVTAGNTNFVAIGASASTATIIFTATGAGSGTGTAVSLSQRQANWPKHMSIWLTNQKEHLYTGKQRDMLVEDEADTESKVLIDSISFRDFNYEITNSSQLDSSLVTSPIKIESGRGLFAPQGLEVYNFFDGFHRTGTTGDDTLDSLFGQTPSILTIGLKEREYLSYDDSTTNSDGFFPWTAWPYGFWLNSFSAANLGKVGDIPDSHIKGTVSMARYKEATSAVIPLGDQLGQKGIDYQEWGQPYGAGTTIPHNLYLAYDDAPEAGKMSFGTKWLNTGLKVNNNYNKVHATYETTDMVTSDDALTSTINIDSTSITIPINQTGAQVAAIIAATSFPTYTAAVTNTRRVTFTQKASPNGYASGNIAIVMTDAIYNKSGELGATHTISKQGGGAEEFSGGIGVTGNSGPILVCTQQTAFASPTGCPVRVGDQVRLAQTTAHRGGDPNGLTYTVGKVKGATNGTTGVDTSLTIYLTGGFSKTNDELVGYHIAVSPPSMCKNFSQKGGFQFYANSTDEHVAVKRENIAASARIMEIVESTTTGTTIAVDTMEPFLCDDDEEYIAYLWGEDATFTDRSSLPDAISSNSANCATGLKVMSKDLDQMTVSLDWDGRSNANGAMINYDNIHRLYISPYRYWIFMMINLTDEYNRELSTRQYGNIQLYNNNWVDKNSVRRSWLGEALHFDTTNDYVDDDEDARAGMGTTWNEYLFNDSTAGGVNGAYLNTWNLDRMPNHSQVMCDTDFGFGSYSEETLTGGFTGKQVVVDSQYNRITMPGVIDGGDLETGDVVNFLLDYNDVGLSHKTTFRTRADTSYPPYLFSVFEDEIPASPTLSVKPYKEDPFLPEITWDASDNDLWYGIIHVDSGFINNQYHNAFFHMPMNESGVHGTKVTAAGNDLYLKDTTNGSTSKTALFSYSGVKVDAEGLAGNCIRFDGNNDNISYNTSSGTVLMPLESSPTASIVVHITPDNGISGATNVIFDGFPFYINYNADSSKIQARCYTGSSPYVALAGPDIITDGQTPTCVIVTIDNELKSGNCKLYINGALVDQSGLISNAAPATDGTGKNWYNNSGTPVPPHTSSSAITVGKSSGSFLGRIEELVIYKSCIYPVVPSDGKFVLDKALKEVEDGTPITNNIRLFIKDYHNIRGSTSQKVAASSPVSFRKAAFRLVD